MPTQQLDLTTWFTKQEAADHLGVSTKAIERFTRAGKLEQRFRPQPGSPHVAVYLPEDVFKVKAERTPPEPAPRVLPPPNGNGIYAGATGTALAVHPMVLHTETLLSVFEAFLRKDASQTSHTAIFLTLNEAAAYSGLPVRELRRAIKAGELPARPTVRNGPRIRRKDLDAL